MEVFWILLAPFAWFIIAKIWLRTTFSWKELGISVLAVTVLTAGTWQLGKYGQTLDHEVWNGQITKKDVSDGYYQTSYCCGTDKDGNCTSTCYDDHYTRSYDGYSTVGNFTFDSIDTGSRMRRNAFGEPETYKRCKIGQPAAQEHNYTNYVQAVPQSLFNDDSKNDMYKDQLPAYPRVHSLYKINRVINLAGVDAGRVKAINDGLSEALKTLGAQKQANIIIVLTSIQDPSYRYAVERAWVGGKKNDITVFVGIENDAITWTDTMTWALNSGNELFHVTMRDGIMSQKLLDPKVFVPFVTQTVEKLYDRPHMKDYEYLADEIEPPTWVFWLAIFFAFGGSAFATYIFHKHEF